MLPLGDDNYGRRTFPIVTILLIVVNVLFFLLELGSSAAFIERWTVVPAHLIADPARNFPTIFTAMFMHAGWLHLLGNMLYLWIFGDNVEDRLGHGKFLIFYFLCGIAATLAQVFANQNSRVPNLGASGAIAGVLAAYLLMFPRARVRVLMGMFVIPLPAIIVIGFWALLQFANEFGTIAGQATNGGGVAYMAHVGGFVAGLVLAPMMGGLSQQPRWRDY